MLLVDDELSYHFRNVKSFIEHEGCSNLSLMLVNDEVSYNFRNVKPYIDKS